MDKESNILKFFDDKEEAQSFFDVLSFFSIALDKEVTRKEKLTEEEILGALFKFSKLIKINQSKIEFKEHSLFKLYTLVEEENLSSYINADNENTNKLLNEHNYIKFLNKHFEEDFYSDHICSILNYNFESKLNLKFCQDIINYCFPNSELVVEKIKANREVSLINFEYQKAPQMRIDIIVDINDDYKMIIENKTKTLEHSNQTTHYYNAVRGKLEDKFIFPIMLSPNGIKAECKHFVSLDYVELFLILSNIISSIEESEVVLLSSFYQELKETFYDPFQKAMEQSQAFRRKHG